MIRFRLLVSLFLFLFSISEFSFGAGKTWPDPRPKLVVVLVIDQFRADYILRYRNQLSSHGFKALVENGSYFPFAEYDIMQSMTGPGHATILTGSYPYLAGIPINDWYDQELHDRIYCTEDRQEETVGAPTQPHVGTSPRNLHGTTLGDEIKNAGLKSRQISVALKDRAAILLGGHRSDLAIWADTASKKWVSSRYYVKSGGLPAWVEQLNQAGKMSGCKLEEPCGIEVTEEAVESALLHEKLGQNENVDLLTVSYSSHDYAGHMYGPNDKKMLDMVLAEDRAIAHLRELIGKQVKGGLKDVVFVLTGDHGVAPAPEDLKDTGIDSGRIDAESLTLDLEAALNLKCKSKISGNWIAYQEDFNFYLNEAKLADSKCDRPAAESEMKSVLLKNKSFALVFTRGEAVHRDLPSGMLGRQIGNTFYPGRTGNVVALPLPFFINKSRNFANHMTGYSYDRMVPLIFSGAGFRHQVFASKAAVIDIAPTLAFYLGILPPALSEGRVLSEALTVNAK